MVIITLLNWIRLRVKMALTKNQRQQVWDKSNGFCWYCGCNLPEKGWHVDHVEPIGRYKNIKITENGVKHINTCEKLHLDTIENMVPTCSKCNLFKAAWNIEQFRSELIDQVERARQYSVNFRNAERYGLIQVTNKPVIFWFEQNR